MIEEKIKNVSLLQVIINNLKSQGKTIAFTNGCFDLLHVGHVKYLEQAKAAADYLIVALNSDQSVKKLKGGKRPIIPQEERAAVIAALESVDYVTVFNELDPLRCIMALKPDILVKGGDWKKEEVVGKDAVESSGGRVVIVPYVEGWSTKSIIEKMRK